MRHEKKCVGCGARLKLKEVENWIDNHGTDYSTKLCKCPICKQINVVEYYVDYQTKEFGGVNFDSRFYDYNIKDNFKNTTNVAKERED